MRCNVAATQPPYRGAFAAHRPLVLENGQQWKVLKGEMKLHKPLQAPEVIVAPKARRVPGRPIRYFRSLSISARSSLNSRSSVSMLTSFLRLTW